MFIGHFALGFAAKRLEPRVSLATSIAAAQLADLLWPAFLLAGWERVAIAPGDTAFTPLRFESYPISQPSVRALTLASLLGWPLLLWPAWADRHRPARS